MKKEIVEPFNQVEFINELRRARDEYNITPVSRGEVRSYKRITILVSTAYLKCEGDIHWVQEIEAQLIRELRKEPLACDPLEMEGVDRSYTQHGKRNATQFDNHRVNDRCWVSEPLPIVKAILKILKEEVKDVRSGIQKHHFRRRVAETLEGEQVPINKHEKKGPTIHRVFESSEDLPGRGCYEVAEGK